MRLFDPRCVEGRRQRGDCHIHTGERLALPLRAA
jgi:hypothetical protein